MNHLNFDPWKGEYYCRGYYKGKKLLILGHSHYRNGQDRVSANRREATKDVIKNHIDNPEHYYFSHIENVVKGRNCSPKKEERKEFWHRVAFSNYIQEALEGPGVRPNESQWSSAREGFVELITSLKPDILFVFSLEVWNRLPAQEHEKFRGSREIIPDDDSAYLWCTDHGTVLGGGFAHSRNRRVARPIIWHAWADWLFRKATRPAQKTGV